MESGLNCTRRSFPPEEFDAKLSETMRSIGRYSEQQLSRLQSSVAEHETEIERLESSLEEARKRAKECDLEIEQTDELENDRDVFKSIEKHFRPRARELDAEIDKERRINSENRKEISSLRCKLNSVEIYNIDVESKIRVLEQLSEAHLSLNEPENDEKQLCALEIRDAQLKQSVIDSQAQCLRLKQQIAEEAEKMKSYEEQIDDQTLKDSILRACKLEHMIEHANRQYTRKQSDNIGLFNDYREAIEEMGQFGIHSGVAPEDKSLDGPHFSLHEIEKIVEECPDITVQEFLANLSD